MPTTTETPVVTVTEAARAVILDLRANEPEGEGLALRLDVTGQSGNEYVYELTFEPLAEAADDDVVGHSGDLPVLVPAGSIDRLRGATLDHVDPTGLVLRNPNRPPSSPVVPTGPVQLEGTLEEKVQQLLDHEINPMLAQHGGFATLERVEDDVVFLGMGGGCQGCGLARMTLSEGIKKAIEDAIPEVKEVVDVTDHAAGENPFYSPA